MISLYDLGLSVHHAKVMCATHAERSSSIVHEAHELRNCNWTEDIYMQFVCYILSFTSLGQICQLSARTEDSLWGWNWQSIIGITYMLVADSAKCAITLTSVESIRIIFMLIVHIENMHVIPFSTWIIEKEKQIETIFNSTKPVRKVECFAKHQYCNIYSQKPANNSDTFRALFWRPGKSHRVCGRSERVWRGRRYVAAQRRRMCPCNIDGWALVWWSGCDADVVRRASQFQLLQHKHTVVERKEPDSKNEKHYAYNKRHISNLLTGLKNNHRQK